MDYDRTKLFHVDQADLEEGLSIGKFYQEQIAFIVKAQDDAVVEFLTKQGYKVRREKAYLKRLKYRLHQKGLEFVIKHNFELTQTSKINVTFTMGFVPYVKRKYQRKI